ncbi:PorP/SprF family type IX secretion system membrane protein [Aestuariivivens sediminicola]|uniref:PorP/SprF family type IX secretion system membrane protein n=1 Tax=Aestuariivivens sediminicola TaxID=2913560 RepID=UPI001F583EC1|nr:type IX secretion system membrane protein PorP/SprF [Aestuariivivens sediminicola]
MKLKDLLKYCLFALITHSYAQELNLPVYTQYLADNDFVVSPTYAGIGDYLKIRANGLTQWVGIKDAPDNQSVYADIRIADRSGLGFSFYNDRNGNTIQTGAKFSFAHHLILDVTSEQYLSLGLSLNVNNFRIDINNFQNYNNDGSPAPIVGVEDDRRTSNINFDVGALYRYKDFFFSLNVNNILDKNIDAVIRQDEPNLLLNYQIYTGYVFGKPVRNGLQFEPSIFYQMFTSDKRSSTDLNFKVKKFGRNDNYFFGGISYRFLNDQFFKPLNIGPMMGLNQNKFYFAYAYQITANGLAAYNSGTHVITIGLNFLRGISNCPCTKTRVRY